MKDSQVRQYFSQKQPVSALHIKNRFSCPSLCTHQTNSSRPRELTVTRSRSNRLGNSETRLRRQKSPKSRDIMERHDWSAFALSISTREGSPAYAEPRTAAPCNTLPAIPTGRTEEVVPVHAMRTLVNQQIQTQIRFRLTVETQGGNKVSTQEFISFPTPPHPDQIWDPLPERAAFTLNHS